MHDQQLIHTLVGGFTAALIFGYVCLLLRLSPIVGFLIAGIVVGPTTPGFQADGQIASQFAEVGVVLLLFDVGLHFDLHELGRVRRIAVPGALLQCCGSFFASLALGILCGLPIHTAIVFGIAMSFASTVVVTRLLADVNELQSQNGNIAIGWLIVQDVFAVLALVLLPSLGNAENTSWFQLIGVLELAALKILIAAAAIVFLGGKLIPWILHGIAATRSRELFTLTVLVLVLGIALVSAQVFGVSMALGAFLAGIVIGQSDFSVRATTEALPMRDAFAVLFFVSVGMLFNPSVFFISPGLFLSALLIAMVFTPLVSIALLLGLGLTFKSSLRVGFAFAQIGEFSFIVANLARSVDLIGEELVQVLVAVSIFSIALSPLLQKLVLPLEKLLSTNSFGRKLLVVRHPWTLRPATDTPGTDSDEILEEFRTVVIGYGPVGRTAARLLKENGIAPTIIEMNPKTIEAIRADGHRAVLGDASHIETLKHAGVESALSLILSASSIQHASNTIRMAKLLNPEIKIIVRSAYLSERANLLKFGADKVFAGEAEVALAMTEYILRDLGATAEQIDRERDRLRSDFHDSIPISNHPTPS